MSARPKRKDPSVFVVRSSSGRTTKFDPVQLGNWLVQNAGTPPIIARRVARRLELQFADEKEIDGRTLRRSALQLVAGVTRGPGSPVFAFSATDIIPPVLSELISGAINVYRDKGYTIDPSDGTAKKETGFGFFGSIDDDTAPRFQSLGIKAARCCNPRDITEFWNEPANNDEVTVGDCPKGLAGICVTFEMEVTDRVTGVFSGSNSGIRTIDIMPLKRTGNSISPGLGRHFSLSKADRTKTEKGTLRLKAGLCVACAFIEGGLINFSIKLTDGDANELIIFRAIDVGGLKGDCCP